ncbi:unnamed protein product [Ascophyllum nodosum]
MCRVLTSMVVAYAMASTATTVSAFTPTVSARSRFVPSSRHWTSKTTAARPSASAGARGLRAVVEPGMLGGVDPVWLHQVFTGIADASGPALDPSSATAATSLLAEGGGLFGTGLNLNPVEFLTAMTETAITGLHDMLQGLGVPSAYGISIIFFTVFVKAITYPLTYQQLASTTKMQALGPKVKELQRRYANNPEAANQAISQLYQTENVNPLAGCLPAIAQIPIFISLYRSLLNLAKENKLTEGFLWIPSLEGPTFDSPPTEMMSWIKEWTDGAPKLGWQDTLAYLTIPVILVLTQSVSMKIMQPAKDPNAPVDESQQASQNVLKFLPLLIGWFSLSVPSALGLYWILNNFISTATSVIIRNKIATEMGDPSAGAKIEFPSLPFGGKESVEGKQDQEGPEILAATVTREGLEDSTVMEQSKGFGGPEVLDAELGGDIVSKDGTPVAAVGADSKSKPKGATKKRTKKKKARKS